MLHEKKTQTAFRLDADLLMRAKRKARQQDITLTRLVEKALEAYVGEFEFPAIDVPESIPSWVRNLSKGARAFTQEELEEDDRLAYILSK